jgi:two-component system nitrate/nitrite response regulator NarL
MSLLKKMKREINTIIIDDHAIFAEGLCSFLGSDYLRVKRIFTSSKEALKYLKSTNDIDLVFSDINMPEINGIDLTKKIKNHNNKIKIIMVSMYEDQNIIKEAYKNQADGYLSKKSSLSNFKKAIKYAFQDLKYTNPAIKETYEFQDKLTLKYSLTNREKEILSYLIKEKSNIEIGSLLNISKRTVETHRKNIMLKLDVKNSIGIAVKTLKYNLLS